MESSILNLVLSGVSPTLRLTCCLSVKTPDLSIRTVEFSVPELNLESDVLTPEPYGKHLGLFQIMDLPKL